MSKGTTALRFIAPILILGLGVAAMAGLVKSKPAAEERPPEDAGVVVLTQIVSSDKVDLTVSAQGTVISSREVGLQPEVAGRVIARSPNLVPGGRFKRGELLLRLDPGEYSLRAAQSAAQVEQARQQLALEESRGELAKEEWEIIGEDAKASDVGRSAALRRPQRAEAEARIQAAQGERDLALLNVNRTALIAPFNGFVRDTTVEVGQYISPGVRLGSLVASDSFWVRVSIPVGKLGYIQVPGFNATEGEGSEVRVWQDLGETRIERRGQILRLYGDLDPVGRMARVLVEIDDPLGLALPPGERGLPLLLGAYVHVAIVGKSMIDVVEIPRSALHAGRYVYVYGQGDRLEIREVEISWRKEDTLLVGEGLATGDEIITSRLGNAVEGIKLRRVSASPGATPPPKSAAPPPKSAEPGRLSGASQETGTEAATATTLKPSGKVAP